MEETYRYYPPKSLEQVRLHPRLYIGRLGNGESPSDGIYVLMKGVVNNSIDEFRMHFGHTIEIELRENTISIRDFGRGIRLEKVVYAVSEMAPGICDSSLFRQPQQIEPNVKFTNALSKSFTVKSFHDGMMKQSDFEKGKLVKEYDIVPTTEKNGTYVEFTPDEEIFGHYRFRESYLEGMIRKFCYTNIGLTVIFNGKKFLIEKWFAEYF